MNKCAWHAIEVHSVSFDNFFGWIESLFTLLCCYKKINSKETGPQLLKATHSSLFFPLCLSWPSTFRNIVSICADWIIIGYFLLYFAMFSRIFAIVLCAVTTNIKSRFNLSILCCIHKWNFWYAHSVALSLFLSCHHRCLSTEA